MRSGIKIIALAFCALLIASLSGCGGGTIGTATRPPRTTMFERSVTGGQLLLKGSPTKAEDEPDQEECKDNTNSQTCPKTID